MNTILCLSENEQWQEINTECYLLYAKTKPKTLPKEVYLLTSLHIIGSCMKVKIELVCGADILNKNIRTRDTSIPPFSHPLLLVQIYHTYAPTILHMLIHDLLTFFKYSMHNADSQKYCVPYASCWLYFEPYSFNSIKG